MLPLRRLRARKLWSSSTSIGRYPLGVDRRRRPGVSRPESASMTSDIPPLFLAPRPPLRNPISIRSIPTAAPPVDAPDKRRLY